MIHTTRGNPKFITLMRRLRDYVPPETFGGVESAAIAILERLWHATASGPIRGDIGTYDDEIIAEACGWPLEATILIDMLVECRWLDRHPEHRLIIHDWHQHAPNHVKGNAAKKGGFLTVSPGEAVEAQPKGSDQGPGPKAQPHRTSAPNQTKPNPTKGGRKSKATGCESTGGDAATAALADHTADAASATPQDASQPVSGPPFDPPDPAIAYRLGCVIGPARSRKDAVLCWGLAGLEPVLGERWLGHVKAAVREKKPPPRNPWAYARKVAADGCREHPGPGKQRLAELLKRVPDPPDDWPRSYAEKVKREAAP